MASGDVVFESEPFDLMEFYKQAGAGEWAWNAKLKNFEGTGPQGEVDMRGNTLGGVFPGFQSGKRYKITMTEV